MVGRIKGNLSGPGEITIRPMFGGHGLYGEVPPEVLADPGAMLSWAWEAIRAGPDSQGPMR